VEFVTWFIVTKLDTEYFDSFTKQIEEGKHLAFEVAAPVLDFSPKLFFRCWYDPMLSGVDKAAALEAFARTENAHLSYALKLTVCA
jgi:hypothetical protein